jgi:hypothetical protein
MREAAQRVGLRSFVAAADLVLQERPRCCGCGAEAEEAYLAGQEWQRVERCDDCERPVCGAAACCDTDVDWEDVPGHRCNDCCAQRRAKG